MTEATDVLVVGGGIVGLATAWRAAKDGLCVTIVIDDLRPPASRAAVGGLSFCPADSVLQGNQAIIGISSSAKTSFAAYVSELEAASGVTTRWRRQPTLMAKLEEADGVLIDKVATARHTVGLTSARLTGDECRAVEPQLSTAVQAGLLLEDHDQIDSRAFTDSLRAACERAGVGFVGGRVATILSKAGGVTGVRLEDGMEIRAADVVVAAGAWSSQLEGLPPELRSLVSPVSGQIVIVRLADGMDAPMHDLRSSGVYLVSRSDRTIVLGATKVERGFECEPTVRAVSSLLSAAAALWPPILACEWQETAVGLRPHARDGLPVVGQTSLRGLHVATAHFRNGVMFGAASADSVVEGIHGRAPAHPFAALSPLREAIR